MFGFLKRLFGGGSSDSASDTPLDPAQQAAEEAEAQAWYDQKSKVLESILGPEHDMVMHAIMPYGIGGALDLYYYPHGIEGTAVATKELTEVPEESPSNAIYQRYELVMFTRHPLDLDKARDESSPFGAAHCNINLLLNHIARYAQMATLNPNETCEFPQEMDDVGGKCLVFDTYAPKGAVLDGDLGLVLVIEIFRDEMDWARENGGAKLIGRLRDAGHYPYSDMDREPVV